MTEGACPSAAVVAQQVRAGDLDPLDVIEDAIARLEQRDPTVRAYLDADLDFARECAERVADRLARGEDPGRLAGVPISLKDNLAVAGRTLTAGSRILEGYRAPETAHAVQRLLDEGAVLLGRTNLDEFAMGSTTELSAWFPTANPWDTERVPGGSSGGSAAAVAAGIVPIALGSDSGGSVRLPAAHCGVTGFRPTQGAVSRHGLVAHASSLDQIGPLAAEAADAALVFEVLAGHDPRDATSRAADDLEGPPPSVQLEGLRIALPEEFLDDPVDPRVLERIDRAQELLDTAGAVTKLLRRGRLPHCGAALGAYQVLACAEAASNLARYDGMHFGARQEAEGLGPTYAATRGRHLGPEVRRRLALGTLVLSAEQRETWYAAALGVRRALRAEWDALFEEYDLIAGPTATTAAPALGAQRDDPLALAANDRLTAPACLAGLPSVSVPCGAIRKGPDKGLPVGLSLTGPAGSDRQVLAAARAFEALHGAPSPSPVAEGAT